MTFNATSERFYPYFVINGVGQGSSRYIPQKNMILFVLKCC